MDHHFDHDVLRAATRLVEAHGEVARDYVAEIIAIASGGGSPGRLEELADRLSRSRRPSDTAHQQTPQRG